MVSRSSLSLPEVFAAEMRRHRLAAGHSQERLGELVGIDRNTLSRIERTAPNVSLERATEIALALGTSLAAMLGGTADGLAPDEIREELATRIGKLRRECGLNQRELGEVLGVDRNWVGLIERGQQNMTLSTLETFAAALDVTPAALLRPVERKRSTGTGKI